MLEAIKLVLEGDPDSIYVRDRLQDDAFLVPLCYTGVRVDELENYEWYVIKDKWEEVLSVDLNEIERIADKLDSL